MLRNLLPLLLLATCLSSGCSLCQSCFDEAYPFYGSVAPRQDRFHGRMGSRFAPAGADVGNVSPYVRETDESQVQHPEPTDPPESQIGPAVSPEV